MKVSKIRRMARKLKADVVSCAFPRVHCPECPAGKPADHLFKAAVVPEEL